MTTTVPVNPEFDKLKKFADEFLDKKDWNASVVISLATSLAVHVNSFVSLSGSEKKQLVIDVVKQELNEALEESKNAPADGSDKLSPEQLQTLIFFVENALPAVLDTLVAVARGKIDLKKVVPSSWASCFSCASASAVQAVKPVPVLTSSPPVVQTPEEGVIPLQSNPLHASPEVKPVEKETPQEKNNHEVSEVQNEVSETPATVPEKS